jgi:hypothetical protein
VFTVRGALLDPAAARRDPLVVAAANWVATACVVAARHPDALLIDVGTTTTDVIPIRQGAVVAEGLTDPDRLASGELVYTGAVRSPVESIATSVPFRGAAAGVSAEGFALSGDVHVWRGDLESSDYTAPTPDGRPPTREYCGERLARVVCADRESIDEAGITAIAESLAAAQTARISHAVRRVAARHPAVRAAVVTGVGTFLGRAAARDAGLDVIPLADELGADAARVAPAACVALLLERGGAAFMRESGVGRALTARLEESPSESLVVVKLGGSLLADRIQFEAALLAIAEMGRRQRLLIVPGGGPFADAVRDVDSRIGVSSDASHWMAILAMDQYAHVIAERLAGATIVTDPAGMQTLDQGRVAVLAPFRWLRDADPLPHSWDVTSDSIAAWVAGQVGADQLIVIKPAGAKGDRLVDPCFATACPPTLRVTIITVDELSNSANFELRTSNF